MISTIAAAVVSVFLSQSRPAHSPGARIATTEQNQDKAAALAAEGWDFWQKHNYVVAQARFERASRLDPNSADIWAGLGWSKFSAGDSVAGEKAFEKAVAIGADHAAAQNGLGHINFNKRNYKEAEKHWLIAIKTPEAAEPFYDMTAMYLLTGQFDKAATFAEKALKTQSKDQPADQTLQDMSEAAKSKLLSSQLRKKIEPQEQLSPDTKRGQMFFDRRQFDKAAQAFQAALKKDPKDMGAHNGLGFILLNNGKVSEAKKHFQTCLDIDPESARPMDGMARCLKAEGKVDAAIALWEKMAKLYPGPNAAAYGLAETYSEKGQYARSVEMWEKIAAADPNDSEAQAGLAKARLELLQQSGNGK